VPRPLIDDWPLIGAIAVLEMAGGDPRNVRRLAARWLHQRRGISLGTARARVATILSGRYPPPATPDGNDEVYIDFDFVLDAVRALHGEAPARRLQAGNAHTSCHRSTGPSDVRVAVLVLAWELRQALSPPEVVTTDCQNID